MTARTSKKALEQGSFVVNSHQDEFRYQRHHRGKLHDPHRFKKPCRLGNSGRNALPCNELFQIRTQFQLAPYGNNGNNCDGQRQRGFFDMAPGRCSLAHDIAAVMMLSPVDLAPFQAAV